MSTDSVHITCPHCVAVNRIPHGRLNQSPKCGKCHLQLFVGKPLELTSENYSTVINRTGIPIIVDFWAPWCGPCKMMAPIFEEVTILVEPQVRMAKLNTEEVNTIAANFGIRSIPTLVVMKNGKEVARQSGVLNKSELMQFIKAYV